MSDNRLLAFHVGPVQEFIATARRTQDLWMGSWLLSHLTRVAFETAKANGAEPILPNELAEARGGSGADFPNHFIMGLPASGAEQIARGAERAVRDEWLRIESRTKEEFFHDVRNELWRGRQTDNLLEIYWALVDDDGTAMARNQAQAALDARKRMRNFVYLEELNLKCTLCGTRQELSESTSVPRARAWWVDRVDRYSQREHLEKLRIRENGNERLCAVCAVKRAAVAAAAAQNRKREERAVPLDKTDASFPSTSSVAAAMFKKRVLETTGTLDAVLAHLQALNDLCLPAKVEADCIPELARFASNPESKRLLVFDGDLFYTETFTIKRIKDDFPDSYERLQTKTARSFGVASSKEALQELGDDFQSVVDDSIRQANGTLRALYRAVNSRPSKYFSALMMDGDHMGQFFAKADKAQAQDLSNRVSRFARDQAKQIVQENYGRLVYAGADDVLALLPLATSLKCARQLQEAFREAVRGIQLPAGFAPPTSSIGIAVAHHTGPLDLTLQTMRHAEKAAKDYYGRDALCIRVLKRSGEEVWVGTHWTNGADESLVSLAEETIELLSEDNNVLSMKFAHAVANEARALNGENMPVEARIAALRRLAKRQSGKHYDEAKAQGLAEKLARWSITKRGPKGAEQQLGLEEVAQWILLARFIAAGGRDEG